MQWYYSVNRQQTGPVSDTELAALAQSGTITSETLVWREGMPNWAPYSTVASSIVVSSAVPATGAVAGDAARCAECGKTFPLADLVTVQNMNLCGTCKVGFLQKLQMGVSTGVGAIFKDKGKLVTRLNSVLPARCVKCNAPTQTPQMKRRLQWHSPAVYFSILLGLLIYIIIALIARKTTTVMVSVCPAHRTKRRNAILIAWLLVLLGIGLFFVSAASNTGWVALVGVAFFLGGIIYGLVKGRLVYASKIDKERVWLNGCGQEFLAEFPDWIRS